MGNSSKGNSKYRRTLHIPFLTVSPMFCNKSLQFQHLQGVIVQSEAKLIFGLILEYGSQV
jgi:hypothetical protein